MFENYQIILGANLFLQTPVPVEDPDSNNLSAIASNLSRIDKDDKLNSKDTYKLYMQSANIARDHILQLKKVESERDILFIYKLWEIRLTTLLLANELSIAQQESKRLSEALNTIAVEEIYRKKSDRKQLAQVAPTFPNDIPLSLKLLLIRLRSIGPNLLLMSEYFLVLWEQRKIYGKEEEEGSRQRARDTIELLAYAVSACMIAKREYTTFLTHADSIITKFDEYNNLEDCEITFYSRTTFLASIISLMKGDWEEAQNYYSKIKVINDVVKNLETILNNVNPVLDHQSPRKESRSKEDAIVLTDTIQLDDIFGLVREQLITGRILCCLCGYFEIQLRNDNQKDALSLACDDDELNKAAATLFSIWNSKVYKLYGFE